MAKHSKIKAEARNFPKLQAAYSLSLQEDLDRQRTLVESLTARKLAEKSGSVPASESRARVKPKS